MAKSKVSHFWYLVPIMFGWLGGVVGFFAVRGRDENKARNLFFVGLAVTIIPYVIIFSIAGSVDAGLIVSPFALLT
ncbi:MAG: hypothetical protein KJI69_04040 [Patescibacteria group bacterium]|nr:hypothetical protein [Patescibacteria group bacterium]